MGGVGRGGGRGRGGGGGAGGGVSRQSPSIRLRTRPSERNASGASVFSLRTILSHSAAGAIKGMRSLQSSGRTGAAHPEEGMVVRQIASRQAHPSGDLSTWCSTEFHQSF